MGRQSGVRRQSAGYTSRPVDATGRQGALAGEFGPGVGAGPITYSVGGKQYVKRVRRFAGGFRRRRRDQDAGTQRPKAARCSCSRLDGASAEGGREREMRFKSLRQAFSLVLRPRLGGVLREVASHARAGCSRRSQGLAPVRGPRQPAVLRATIRRNPASITRLARPSAEPSGGR